jgi:hypothetical protein
MADAPVDLALVGPRFGGAVAVGAGPLFPGDRLALLLLDPGPNADELWPCIAGGMRARLPSAGPAPLRPEAPRTAGLLAVARAAEADDRLAVPPAGLGYDWLVAVTDRSSSGPEEETSEGLHGGGALGVAIARGRRYALDLQARVLDLRAGRRIGTVGAHVDTRSRAGVAAGLFGGTGAAAPLILPMVELPAGTSALAICDAFGRAVGDALVAATAEAPGRQAIPPRGPTDPARTGWAPPSRSPGRARPRAAAPPAIAAGWAGRWRRPAPG